MTLASGATAAKTCVICYDNINSRPSSEKEQERVLNCSHIFHRECIAEWLKQKPNCPVCRAHVELDTPESAILEMTSAEISLSIQNIQHEVRHVRLGHIRIIDLTDLNENSLENRVSAIARTVWRFPPH